MYLPANNCLLQLLVISSFSFSFWVLAFEGFCCAGYMCYEGNDVCGVYLNVHYYFFCQILPYNSYIKLNFGSVMTGLWSFGVFYDFFSFFFAAIAQRNVELCWCFCQVGHWLDIAIRECEEGIYCIMPQYRKNPKVSNVWTFDPSKPSRMNLRALY